VLESQPDRRTLLGHVVTIGSNSVDRWSDLGASTVTHSRAGQRCLHQSVGERARDGSQICISTGMQRPANLLETPSNRLSPSAPRPSVVLPHWPDDISPMLYSKGHTSHRFSPRVKQVKGAKL